MTIPGLIGVLDIGSGAGLALALQEVLMADNDVSVIGFSAGGVGAPARLAAATDAPAAEEEQPGGLADPFARRTRTLLTAPPGRTSW